MELLRRVSVVMEPYSIGVFFEDVTFLFWVLNTQVSTLEVSIVTFKRLPLSSLRVALGRKTNSVRVKSNRCFMILSFSIYSFKVLARWLPSIASPGTR